MKHVLGLIFIFTTYWAYSGPISISKPRIRGIITRVIGRPSFNHEMSIITLYCVLSLSLLSLSSTSTPELRRETSTPLNSTSPISVYFSLTSLLDEPSSTNSERFCVLKKLFVFRRKGHSLCLLQLVAISLSYGIWLSVCASRSVTLIPCVYIVRGFVVVEIVTIGSPFRVLIVDMSDTSRGRVTITLGRSGQVRYFLKKLEISSNSKFWNYVFCFCFSLFGILSNRRK